MDDWPGWATEQVRVQAPCPAWRQHGEQLCRHLDAALGRWLVAPIEHVGSTAVPGVAAKPILDVQAAVLDLDCAQAIAPVLALNRTTPRYAVSRVRARQTRSA